MQSAPQQPAFGWEPAYTEIIATNRTGAAHEVGDLCQLDLSNAQSEVTTNQAGSSASGFANVIVPADFTAAAGNPLGKIYCVALETNADNTVGRYCIQGRCKAKVANGSGHVGVKCVPAASSTLDADSVLHETYVAVTLEDSGAAGETLIDVLFNGANAAFGTATSA